MRTVAAMATAPTVRANPLKTNGETAADGADANFPPQSARKDRCERLAGKAMSAVDALRAAKDAGVSVTLDGGDLVLHASAEPPHTVLSGLSRHKAAIVALLRGNDLWTAPAGEPRPIPIRELIAAAVVNGTTFSLSGAHVRLGGTPPPPNIQRELRARRKEVWDHLGGAALDQPALELMVHLGVEAVLVTNPAEALAALGNGPLGVDIETAHRLPRPPARFTRRGDLSATQPKSDDEAGLDPHHAEIATLQLYAGGQQSFVFRGAAITSEVRRRVLQGNCIVHNAAFELAFFRHHWGAFPVQFECTMQAAGLLLGVHRRGLADTAYACMGVKVPKELQRSDWGAEELSAGQIAYAAADAVLAYRLWPRLSEGLRTKQRYQRLRTPAERYSGGSRHAAPRYGHGRSRTRSPG